MKEGGGREGGGRGMMLKLKFNLYPPSNGLSLLALASAV